MSTPKRFDLYSLQFATSVAQQHIERTQNRLARLEQDVERGERIRRHECPSCYYLVIRICGQAFTQYKCGWCFCEFHWHNTCVPRFCAPCGEKLGICVRCGADVHLRSRRTLERKGRDGSK